MMDDCMVKDHTMDDAPATESCQADLDPEKMLEALCRRAQQEFESQPLPTQKHLSQHTRHVWAKYAQDGTAASLRGVVNRYFDSLDSRQNNAKMPFSPHLPFDHEAPPPNPKDSRMVDEDSRFLVRDMPFLVDRKFHIRNDMQLPVGLIEALDRIFRIYQFEAEAMLRHHCDKYGAEAIFRLGIRSLILSRSESVLECTTANPLGLDPDNRLFFLQVYERHPDLNIAEKRILARAARVEVDVVDTFWAQQTSLRAPYFAMRTVIAARELRKQREYKEQVEQRARQKKQEAEDRKREEEERKTLEERRREDARQSLLQQRTLYVYGSGRYGRALGQS